MELTKKSDKKKQRQETDGKDGYRRGDNNLSRNR